MGVVLSKAEKEFLEALKAGDISGYNANYRRQLKFKILKKQRGLTSDLLLINEVIDKLQEL